MLSPTEIRQLLTLFPVGLCWDAHVREDGAWYVAELHRHTPDGADVLACGTFRDEVEAWSSCIVRARQVYEAYREGDSGLLSLLRASIQYAREARGVERVGRGR